jgi:hypothetical protein
MNQCRLARHLQQTHISLSAGSGAKRSEIDMRDLTSVVLATSVLGPAWTICELDDCAVSLSCQARDGPGRGSGSGGDFEATHFCPTAIVTIPPNGLRPSPSVSTNLPFPLGLVLVSLLGSMLELKVKVFFDWNKDSLDS